MAASAPPREPQLPPRPLRRTGPIIPRREVAAPDEQDEAQRKQQANPGQANPGQANPGQANPGQQQGSARARDAMLRRTGPIVPRAEGLRVDERAPSQKSSADVLLLEPSASVAPPLHTVWPSLGELLAHPFKTLYMVVALLVDRRVSFVRKLAFVVPIAVLVAALLVPETVVGVLAGIVAPIVGLALDLPIDAAVDWLGVGLLSVALLHVFPAGIVAQYHAQLFHKQREA